MDLVERATYLRICDELSCESTRGWFIEDCEPPAGAAAGALLWIGNARARYRKPAKVDDSLAIRIHDNPWFITIWEPLPTHAPGPDWTQPYCCYVNHVIFYHRPHVEAEYMPHNGRGLLCIWDRIDTELGHDDLLTFEDETFRVQSGTIVWRADRWWQRLRARREGPAPTSIAPVSA